MPRSADDPTAAAKEVTQRLLQVLQVHDGVPSCELLEGGCSWCASLPGKSMARAIDDAIGSDA